MIEFECESEGFNLNLRHKCLVGIVWNKQQIENEGTPTPKQVMVFPREITGMVLVDLEAFVETRVRSFEILKTLGGRTLMPVEV